MTEDIDDKVFVFCERLRQVRKLFNFRIVDLAERTGLSYGQIRRLEGEVTKKNNKTIKTGGEGVARTLIILLLYYCQRISIDMLLNLNIPVETIPIDKGVEKDITREKLIKLIGNMHELIQFLG